jgi:hypothetical protein
MQYMETTSALSQDKRSFAMRVVLIFVESESAFVSVLCIRKTNLAIAGLYK